MKRNEQQYKRFLLSNGGHYGSSSLHTLRTLTVVSLNHRTKNMFVILQDKQELLNLSWKKKRVYFKSWTQRCVTDDFLQNVRAEDKHRMCEVWDELCVGG